MTDTQDANQANSPDVLEETSQEDSSKKPVSPLLQEMLASIEGQPDTEAKLTVAVGFMARALAQTGSPQFQTFWALRRLCQTLFKESLSQGVRLRLWTHFRELIEEARRLKTMFDEQSAFAVEQIEMAISSLESDLEQKKDSSPKMTFPKALKQHEETYRAVQQELNVLNVCASRITAMRKELIKTEMRTGQKNKFFQRLSAAGDKVFPRRKELIKQLSDLFLADVEAFIQTSSTDDKQAGSLAFLRQEVKSLQSLAKLLTLNTQGFTKTRLHLSQLWDKMKDAEKESKREQAQQRAASKEKADQIKKVEQERRQNEKEREQKKREALAALHKRIDDLLESPQGYTSSQLAEEKSSLMKEIKADFVPRDQRVELERKVKTLSDLILDHREKELLSLSTDDSETLQNLHTVLQERMARRTAIRHQIELLRKAAGASGRDFEQAMLLNTQREEERSNLERVEQGILEIEEKIQEIEDRLE